MRKQNRKTMAYLRVSTADQDLEKNKAAILDYANNMDFGKVLFVEEKISGMKSWKKRKLATLVDSMNKGDRLIVSELSRLGRSLIEVLEVLNLLTDKDVAVYSVKENFQLNGRDMQSKIMRTFLGLFAEVERDLISARTKEGLAAARKKGVKLGRPKGPGKSKLDEHKDEIINLLILGVPKSKIAIKFGTSPVNLWNWLRKNNIKIKQEDVEVKLTSLRERIERRRKNEKGSKKESGEGGS